ncbi:uncharacterized protein LOC132920231 [Rhopalosiphum padi]|uniref:uncharacterized protein LOC132920231 n=1 Tax=Rhopalosiphum padi TaxID=40932 RepID=UPI00298DD30E|nr:uncharacterized protein LOC132920231 [Rhopalosiphum padi]XP_060838442.1 uncharacterized protein LOC132920231 [Rhopalosiphum padi]
MEGTKCFQIRTRQKSFYHTGVVMYFICAQLMISIDSAALVNAVAIGVAVEDKVTLPSRNEATNPLKEPTPSTLQGAFLSGNLTDVTNGSTSTSPAEASVTSTTAAAAAETVWNVQTAAVATLPADGRNASVMATKPEPATTIRPLESWADVVQTSTDQPSSSQSSGESVGGGDYGRDLNNKNLVANMLKSWFNHKDDPATPAAAANKGYFTVSTKYMVKNGMGEKERGPVTNGDAEVGPGAAPSSKAVTVAVVAGNKSLFERWDEASEEQERVLEDAMRSQGPTGDAEAESNGSDSSSSSSVLAADQNTPSRWFVLLLSGNSTVAQMRRTDFAKYLKLNLAARLSLEYDEVKINRVLVVPPRLMVNVSVVPVSERASSAASVAAVAAVASSSFSSWSPSASDKTAAAISDRVVEDDDPLHNLVETNATLMELSGEEYRVEKFMSLKSQKPQSMEEATAVVSDRHADIDFFIYATVGPLCFVVVLGFLLLTLYKYVRKHPVQWPWTRKFRHPSFWPEHQHRHRRMTDECGANGCDFGASSLADDDTSGGGTVNVIYSGEFEQSQQQQLSGSWLDDASFVPDDSLDRIRTPTLRRTVPPKNKTFTDMLQQYSGVDGDDTGAGVAGGTGVDGGRGQHLHRHRPLRDGQCAAAVHHAQSPRLSRDNKLRILGCKQSCLLLPAVQPVAAAENTTATTATSPPPLPAVSPSQPSVVADDRQP